MNETKVLYHTIGKFSKFTLPWKIAKTSIFYLSVLYQSRTAVQLDFGRTLRYWIRANGLYNYLEKTYDIS